MKRVILCVLFLGACSDQSIIDAAYPDRDKFAFSSQDGESIFVYTCASGSTPNATKERATQAHGYLDKRLSAAVAAAEDAVFEDTDRSQALRAARVLDAEIEDIVETTEERYRCLFVDSRDV